MRQVIPSPHFYLSFAFFVKLGALATPGLPSCHSDVHLSKQANGKLLFLRFALAGM